MASVGREFRQRRQGLEGADRQPGGGKALELAAGTGGDGGRIPAGIGEAGLVPAVLHQPGVVILAAVDRGKRDRPRSSLPTAVGDDRFHGPVLVLQPEQGQRLKLAEGKGDLRVTPAVDVEEPVAQEQPGGVRPGPEGGGDIVRVVQASLVVLGPAGRQEIGAHLAAVERQLVLAQAAHLHERPPEVRLDRELPAQQHRFVGRLGGFQVGGLVRVGGADPPCALPVGGVQHAHGPLPRRAPGRRRASLVPHPHFPPHGLVRGERPTRVGHLCGLLGKHFA